jgi:hypothetical protein
MSIKGLFLLFLAATFVLPDVSSAQRNAPTDAPFVIEHSYWIKPGKTEQFLELLRRNKLPLLQQEAAEGRILWMRITRPRLRSGDDAQWDVRLTIAWRNAAVAWDDQEPSRFAAKLYKDPEARVREEKEREDLLIKMSDVPVQEELVGVPGKRI